MVFFPKAIILQIQWHGGLGLQHAHFGVKLIIKCFQNPQQTSLSVMTEDTEALTADPDKEGRPSLASSWSLTDLVQRLTWECSGPRLSLAVAAVWQYWVLLWLHDSQESQAGGGEALFSSNRNKSPSSIACWIWKDFVFGLLMFVYFLLASFSYT